MPKPSYIDGMYPLVGRPKYPSLRRGCVFAAAPCLGPSGLTLFDWSGFKRHGALTNMDPATDWIISGGRYVLDFDGTNDFTEHSVPQEAIASVGAVAIWFRTTTSSSVDVLTISEGTSTTNYAEFYIESGLPKLAIRGGATIDVTGTATANSGSLRSVVYSQRGTEIAIYVDGRKAGSTSTTAWLSAVSNAGFFRIGAIRYNNTDINFFSGSVAEVRIYSTPFSDSQIALFSRRPGISHEVAERQFDPGTNRRRRVLIGA